MRHCFIVERVDRHDGMPRLVAERLPVRRAVSA
jgi:hypothetical protein